MDSFSADYWQLTNRDTYELFCLFPCNPNPLTSMDDYLNRLCFQFLKEAGQKKHFTSKGSYSQSMVRKHNRRLCFSLLKAHQSLASSLEEHLERAQKHKNWLEVN